MSNIGTFPFTITNTQNMDANPLMSDLNYIQSQVNINCAPIDSPALTGTPTAPTPAIGDNSTNIATTQFVNNSVIGRNVIINADCSVSQINGSTLITPATGTWPIDMVKIAVSQASKLQTQQVTTALNSLGATTSLTTSVLASYSPISTDQFTLELPIEGLNFARFQYGTANAKAGSLQFKANASVSGTYSGAIINYVVSRSYPFQFVLSSNTDTLVTIPNIPGDTGGSWVGATTAGAAYIIFDVGSGVNFKSSAATWQTGTYFGVTSSTNLVAQTNGSTLTVTDVQFEPSPICTQFERKLFSQNLFECQRYYGKTFSYATLPAQNAGFSGAIGAVGIVTNTSFSGSWKFPNTMRAAPTIVTYSPNAASANWSTNGTTPTVSATSAGDSGVTFLGTTSVTVNNVYSLHATADARI